MLEKIDSFLIKHSKKFIVYYVATILLFLVFGAPGMTEIKDKALMVFGVVVGMFFFPFALKFVYRLQWSNRRIIKVEKAQLAFFQVFACMIILTVAIGIVSDPKMFAYTLMVSNIGLMLTIELAKKREDIRSIS